MSRRESRFEIVIVGIGENPARVGDGPGTVGVGLNAPRIDVLDAGRSAKLDGLLRVVSARLPVRPC